MSYNQRKAKQQLIKLNRVLDSLSQRFQNISDSCDTLEEERNHVLQQYNEVVEKLTPTDKLLFHFLIWIMIGIMIIDWIGVDVLTQYFGAIMQWGAIPIFILTVLIPPLNQLIELTLSPILEREKNLPHKDYNRMVHVMLICIACLAWLYLGIIHLVMLFNGTLEATTVDYITQTLFVLISVGAHGLMVFTPHFFNSVRYFYVKKKLNWLNRRIYKHLKQLNKLRTKIYQQHSEANNAKLDYVKDYSDDFDYKINPVVLLIVKTVQEDAEKEDEKGSYRKRIGFRLKNQKG